MAHEVIMPALGMAQDTGLLVRWLKTVGDQVRADDVLMEVETDKSTMEVPAGSDGFIAELRAEAGQDVPVGQVIALISPEPPDPSTTPVNLTQESAAPEPEPEASNEPETILQVTPPVATPIFLEASSGRILASPKARRLAKEAGLDLSRLADAGISQPYHAADLETLKNLPIVQPAGDKGILVFVSHVGAQVPAADFDAFIAQMRDEGGVELTLSALVIAFAASGLRRATNPEELTISMRDHESNRQIFVDPDRLRLSAISGVVSEAASNLEVRNAGESYLTNIALDPHRQPVLSIARANNIFHLTLTFSAADLTPDQAIEAMHELTTRLAEPMLALV